MSLKREKVLEKVLEILKQAKIPVSVDYVAKNVGVGWGTARGFLFELALQGEIIAEKTTKSWVFRLPQKT